MGKMTNEQKNRFAIAEKVITRDALASGLTLEDLISVADYVERGAVWRKPAKKKRRKGGARGPVRKTTADPRAWWAPAGEPLPNPWKPWDLAVPTVAGATLEKFAEKVRDGDLAAEPVPVTLENGIDLREVRTRLDSTEADEQFPPASPVQDLSPAGWEAALKNAAKTGRSQQETEEHMNECSLCRELAELDARGELTAEVVKEKAAAAGIIARPRLDDEEKAEETSSPVGEDPGDRGILTQWAEAIRSRNAEQERELEAAALEGEKLEKATGDTLPPADDGRPLWSTRPEVRTVTLTPASSPVDKRLAEETMGLVPGALDEELTITNEGTFLPDGSPAEVALREVEVGKTNDSAGAKNWVLQEGVRVGCPECSAEVERRRERDESLKRGRRKLASRIAFRGQLRTGPLDDDELLAVAGGELYPAMDEEPSREVKIRNRKGEVWTWAGGIGKPRSPEGWTLAPADPWGLRLAWTSSEMVRRGPWHVV